MDGFSLFLKTIPLNLYALLTLAFLIWLMAADFDFGPMKSTSSRIRMTISL